MCINKTRSSIDCYRQLVRELLSVRSEKELSQDEAEFADELDVLWEQMSAEEREIIEQELRNKKES